MQIYLDRPPGVDSVGSVSSTQVRHHVVLQAFIRPSEGSVSPHVWSPSPPAHNRVKKHHAFSSFAVRCISLCEVLNLHYMLSFDAFRAQALLERRDLSATTSLLSRTPPLSPAPVPQVQTMMDPNSRCCTTGSFESTSP